MGAGVSGLCMGKKLKDRSVNFTILEAGGELGGTWRDNTYPGNFHWQGASVRGEITKALPHTFCQKLLWCQKLDINKVFK